MAVAGPATAGQYFAGYLLEKALSADNVFVFVMLFASLAVPAALQRRVLQFGVAGALLLRGAFIAAGGALIEHIGWIFYVFGALVVLAGARMFRSGAADAPGRNLAVRALRRVLPVTDGYAGGRFFVRLGGKTVATPLFVALVAIEATDLVFAVDSIPAVFGVTRDLFVVFTSNAFAVLGLRALYFLLAGLVDRFAYLKQGIAVLLVFIGGKMLISPLVHLPVWISLAAIAVVAGGAVAASRWRDPTRASQAEQAGAARAGAHVTALASLQVDSAISYAIAVIIPALDAVLPVLPSETVIIALGVATAGSTDPRIALLVACAAVGALLGDNLSYLLGRRFGPHVERRFFGGEKGARRRAWAERALAATRDAAHRRLPVHSRRADGSHAVLRHHRLSTAPLCHRDRGRGHHLGDLFISHRTAGRTGLRGQALGRVAAGVRRHDRHQRADRGDPANQILQMTGPGRHEGVTPDRLRPMTPARIRPIDTSFRVETASPRKIMPTAAAPTAPIPVHTAYAAPTSSSRSATVSSAKLISAHTAKVAVGHGRVIPWLSFSATAKPVSNRPAARIISHAIASPLVLPCSGHVSLIWRRRGIPVCR